MHLSRFVIGIKFNEHMFRLQSIGGAVVDDLLKLRNTDAKLGEKYFTLVNLPINSINGYAISLTDENRINELTISQDQFIFKKYAANSNAALNIDKVIDEFTILWKAANKSVLFSDVRRIGFVGEYRIGVDNSESPSTKLIECLTKFKKSDECHGFSLTFEDRKRNKVGEIINKDTDDFWNTIFSFYDSERDEISEKGKINANIDIQKYFNPAKKDPLRELTLIKKMFVEEKRRFKDLAKDMGLTN